jgi:hypothetical protein
MLNPQNTRHYLEWDAERVEVAGKLWRWIMELDLAKYIARR